MRHVLPVDSSRLSTKLAIDRIWTTHVLRSHGVSQLRWYCVVKAHVNPHAEAGSSLCVLHTMNVVQQILQALDNREGL